MPAFVSTPPRAPGSAPSAPPSPPWSPPTSTTSPRSSRSGRNDEGGRARARAVRKVLGVHPPDRPRQPRHRGRAQPHRGSCPPGPAPGYHWPGPLDRPARRLPDPRGPVHPPGLQPLPGDAVLGPTKQARHPNSMIMPNTCGSTPGPHHLTRSGMCRARSVKPSVRPR